MTSATIPFAVSEGSVRVERQCFRLTDGTESDDIESAVDALSDQNVVSVAGTAVAFMSAASDHYATVRAEFYDSPPPPVEGYEAVLATMVLSNVSGSVIIDNLTGGGSGCMLEISGSATYDLRVACRGRDAAAAEAQRRFDQLNTDDEIDLFFRGIEQWLVQLWPATSEASGLR